MRAANESKSRAKSVIYIFLSGGLAQHESFDPKPDAPAEIRGEFGTIPTRTPGVRITEHLPRLATCSDKWAMVRSLTNKSNDHSLGHHIMLTGRSDAPVGFNPSAPRPTDHPAIASIAGAVAPARNNLPPAVVLPAGSPKRQKPIGPSAMTSTAKLLMAMVLPCLLFPSKSDSFELSQSRAAFGRSDPGFVTRRNRARLNSGMSKPYSGTRLPGVKRITPSDCFLT